MAYQRVSSITSPEVVAALRRGGTVVLRTDTIYGIVARADDEDAVARLYQIRSRTPTKKAILLIASTEQMYDTYDTELYQRLLEFWPGPNSIELPSKLAPAWLTRNTGCLSYRMPAHDDLRTLVAKIGPLIAPSANPEGKTPARSIDEAIEYFGDMVDVYVDGGVVGDVEPSRLYRLTPDGAERLR